MVPALSPGAAGRRRGDTELRRAQECTSSHRLWCLHFPALAEGTLWQADGSDVQSTRTQWVKIFPNRFPASERQSPLLQSWPRLPLLSTPSLQLCRGGPWAASPQWPPRASLDQHWHPGSTPDHPHPFPKPSISGAVSPSSLPQVATHLDVSKEAGQQDGTFVGVNYSHRV